MKKEDLLNFCIPGNLKIGKPWSRGDKTYVTDGHVILRLDRIEDVEENVLAPDATKLFRDFPAPADGFIPIPDLPEAEYKGCDSCDGTGKWAMKGKSIPCDECNGAGKFEIFKRLDIGGTLFQVALLRRIKENLPNAELCVNKAGTNIWIHTTNPSWIRFEGGDGLIMPCERR